MWEEWNARCRHKFDSMDLTRSYPYFWQTQHWTINTLRTSAPQHRSSSRFMDTIDITAVHKARTRCVCAWWLICETWLCSIKHTFTRCKVGVLGHGHNADNLLYLQFSLTRANQAVGSVSLTKFAWNMLNAGVLNKFKIKRSVNYELFSNKFHSQVLYKVYILCISPVRRGWLCLHAFCS